MTQTAASDEATWWDRAACQGLPSEWFVPIGDAFEEADDAEEPWEPDPRAQAFCIACPVRPECLAFALAHPDLRGTWGGASFHQRRQLRRVRDRLACSVCGGTTTITLSSLQFCASCGLSWRTAPAG